MVDELEQNIQGSKPFCVNYILAGPQMLGRKWKILKRSSAVHHSKDITAVYAICLPTKMEELEYDFASLYGCTPFNVAYVKQEEEWYLSFVNWPWWSDICSMLSTWLLSHRSENLWLGNVNKGIFKNFCINEAFSNFGTSRMANSL